MFRSIKVSAKRDVAATKAFFRKAINNQQRAPTVWNAVLGARSLHDASATC